jgi:phosphoribosyl 1,2-cyclic phosphodiesterase
MPVRFCPIASGSSGNCAYAGAGDAHFLIDAGISAARITRFLSQADIKNISGVFITHEHSDHISGVGVLARRYKTPVYATPNTWRYLLRHKKLGEFDEGLAFTVEPGVPFTAGGFEVEAFDIPHDASQPVGYTLTAGGVKIAVATDMGQVTDGVRVKIRHSNILLLESNHDVEMLQYGRYPKALKERVMGPRGHLSNAAAGGLLAEAAHEHLQYAFLGHLSEENNRPMIAMDTVQRILESRRVTVRRLAVADRDGPGEMAEV